MDRKEYPYGLGIGSNPPKNIGVDAQYK